MRRVALAWLRRHEFEIVFVRGEVGVGRGCGVDQGEVEARGNGEGEGIELAAADHEDFAPARRARGYRARRLKRIDHHRSRGLVARLPRHDDIGAVGEGAKALGERLPRLAPHHDRVPHRERLKAFEVVGEAP